MKNVCSIPMYALNNPETVICSIEKEQKHIY